MNAVVASLAEPFPMPFTAVRMTERDRRGALAISAVSALVFAALVPFATVRLPRVDAFIPMYQMALIVNDLVTTALLAGAFLTARSRRIFVLACGYLFTASMTFLHTLTFPGLFAPAGLLRAGEQTTAWLYAFWHVGFPAYVLAYLKLRDARLHTWQALMWLVGTVALVVVLVLLATVGESLLPPVMSGDGYRPMQRTVFLSVWAFSLAALVVAARQPRKSLLDLWLAVILVIWACEIGLAAVFNGGRFDLGFYAGRTYGLIASGFLLLLLLVEHGVLNARLGRVQAENLRAAQSALAESEAKFRTLAQSLPAFLFITDAAGDSTFVNDSFLRYSGRTQESLMGGRWVEVIHPDDRVRAGALWARVVRTGDPYEIEYRMRRFDGVHRWFLCRAMPLRDSAGEISGWCGAIVDIDDAREARAELREANRSKDEFLATLAHELRNPLAPIANAVRVLANGRATPEAKQWSRDVIERQVATMARLLDDLLDVSRITRKKLELRRQVISLSEVIDRAIETSGPLIEARGHRLVVDGPDPDARIEADAVRLCQVIANLLNNAAKYTPNGGVIELRVRADDATVTIEVQDNGIGLDEAAMQRLFKMFSQVETSIARADGGLGIGLSLVKGLVELHGGHVSARSAGHGHGSTFVVTLPRGDVATQVPAHSSPGCATSAGRRVLVVDDNEDGASSFAMLLRLEGHDVQVAHSGAEALVAVDRVEPDFAFLDIGMPNMDGYELARRLRQKPLSRRPVLVALTGWGQAEDKKRAQEAGFDHHFTKPVDFERALALLT